MYFNKLLSNQEKGKIKKQLDREDMMWAVYFEGTKFPVSENESFTLYNFEVYAFDLNAKKIHRFSSW